ncbi:MAG: beta-N-acetylhexosaminidase [Verrucomicrobiaceae bacterium]
MNVVLSIICALFLSGVAAGVVPAPREMAPRPGHFAVNGQTSVRAPAGLKGEARALLVGLGEVTGNRHREIPHSYRNAIPGGVVLSAHEGMAEGEYRVSVYPRGVDITGHDAEAVFQGVQTFLQLIPLTRGEGGYLMPCVEVRDSPARVRREVKLDVARHVFPLKDLMRFVDQLAAHKFNVLSLHLSDDQGWRFESKQYPKLTGVGAVRKSTPPYGDRFGSDEEEYGGFYTQEMLGKLVAYAKGRHVEIVPVIALPGRVSAMLAAYPGLGVAGEVEVGSDWSHGSHLLSPTEETLRWLEPLFAEMAAVFPGEVIGIHDAQPDLKEWEESAAVKLILEERKVKDVEALWDDFLARVGERIAKEGRTMRLESSVRHLDFDQYQLREEEELKVGVEREAVGGLLTVRDVYEAEPAVAALWTPYMHEWEKVEYMAFPRLAAMSEVLWTPEEGRSYEDFTRRLELLRGQYLRQGMKVAEVYEEPRREALHGTKVTSTLGHHLDYWPELAFDGKKETFFWSDRGLEPGDAITVTFPHAVSGEIEVATGGDALEGAQLADGVLEVSADGKEWDALAEFFDGLATVNAPEGTVALRVRVTGAQKSPLIIHEVVLGTPLLPTRLDEVRTIKISDEQSVTIGLKADFTAYPEYREKVGALRERYFSLWLRAASFFGVVGLPGTPESLTLAFGEKAGLENGVLTFDSGAFAKASLEEVEGVFIEGLCEHLQAFNEDAPTWFAEGLTATIRAKELPDSAWAKELPAEPRKADAVTGGWGSASFLDWVVREYTAFPISQVSQSCRSQYSPQLWEVTTGLTLEKLVEKYQE